MQVGGLGGAGAIWLQSVGKTGDSALAELFAAEKDGKNEPANPAASNTSFPTAPPVSLDANALLALQEVDAETIKGAVDGEESGAVRDFLDYMKKSPEERIRDRILKALGVTEEDIANMSPDERLAIEEKIKEIVKETIVKIDSNTRAEPADRAAARQAFAQLLQQA